MTTCFLAPDPIQGTFFIPGGNTPGNGAQLFLYVAGSSTKQTAYKDNAAATPWTNPIVLDSGGNLPNGAEVWFPTGQTFKAVWAPSNDTDPPGSPYRTMDNLAGMNDVSSTAQSEWIAGPAPTFISATQFTLVGDQTANFTLGRRVKTTNTAGTVYSVITSVSFAAGTTTVNVVSDSGSLDSGLSAVFFGILDPSNPSTNASDVNRKGATVASAGNGTTNIWGTVGDYIHVSGTNTINFFSTAPYAGARKELIFDGILSLTFNNPTLLLNGGSTITTAANDRASVRAESVSTYVVEFVRNNGQPLVAGTASTGIAISGPNIGLSVSTMTGASTGTAINNTGVQFITAQVAQGTVGLWIAGASGTFKNSVGSGTSQVYATLQDGSSTVARVAGGMNLNLSGTNGVSTLSFGLSGVFLNPSGNIRLNMQDTLDTNGVANECKVWAARIG